MLVVLHLLVIQSSYARPEITKRHHCSTKYSIYCVLQLPGSDASVADELVSQHVGHKLLKDLLLCRLFLGRLRKGTTTVPQSESYLSLSQCALQLAMPQVCLTLSRAASLPHGCVSHQQITTVVSASFSVS